MSELLAETLGGALFELFGAMIARLFRVLFEGSVRSLPLMVGLLCLSSVMCGPLMQGLQAQITGVKDLTLAQVAAMVGVPNPQQLYHIAGTKIVAINALNVRMNGLIAPTVPFYYGVLTINSQVSLVFASPDPIDPNRTLYTGSFATLPENRQEIMRDLPDGSAPLLPFYFMEHREVENQGLIVTSVFQAIFGLFILFAILKFVRNTLIRRMPLSAYTKTDMTGEADGKIT